jgi:hypothetical protein
MTRFRWHSGVAVAVAASLLATACGEKIPRSAQEQPAAAFEGHVCDLVQARELSQIFVSELTADRQADGICTWSRADSGVPAFSYQVHPYMEDLQSEVRKLAGAEEGEFEIVVRLGLGNAAIWSDMGLFVSRGGRTLQVTPHGDDDPRALFEELASLLLERLEAQ